MGPDEADVNDAVWVVDPYDDAILISRYVEHHAAIFQKARVADLALHIGRCRPVGLQDLPIPSQRGLTRISVFRPTIDELLDRPEGYDAHQSL